MLYESGTRLGPYEILSPLGAGGMGEVYRATDCKLKREVALKVLPQLFVGDAQRMLRFEREAQVLASLNHPSIAQIYGVEEAAGQRALVMELVEGPTLAERIAEGPMALDEVALLAKQIAEGLEYAHDRGIIHRDLKPANVKVTPDGQLKILDFGLAKALVGENEKEDNSTSPTISLAATKVGMLLGTAGYMSPEQAKGKAVDRRADIWAFGCVLYEMLTGEVAFDGETITDKLAAVVRAEADLSQLPEKTPARIRELLHRCLIKDPKQRLQSIGEARITLEKYLANPSEATAAASPVEQMSSRRNWQWPLAGLAVVSTIAAIVFGAMYWNRVPARTRMVRSYLRAMPNSSFLLTGSTSGFALSPDGTQLAYVAQSEDGKAMLWVRRLDAAKAQMLEGTQDSVYPFWSPDSKYIGFFASQKLKRIEATGGPVLTLCDAANPRGGSWSQQGVILFTPNVYGAIYQVPAAGGTPSQITTPNVEKRETTNRWPHFLPDGEHFLYLAGMPLVPQSMPSGNIRIGALHSNEAKDVLPAHANAIYASGHLLYLRGNTLMAQAFDLKKLEVSGEAIPIADPIQEDLSTLKSMVAASQEGTMVFLEGTSTAPRALLWVDRTGKKLDEVPGHDTYRSPRLSPDGTKISFTLSNSGFDVWDYDIARKVKTRLTFGSGGGQGDLDSVWSTDGKRIAYTSIQNGQYSFRIKAADGSGNDEELLAGTDKTKNLTDWSRDGKYIMYQELQQKLYYMPVLGNRIPVLFQAANFGQALGVFSPDIRWVAFCSTESGEQRVYVVPFPGPGGKWQVSSGSGCMPRWRQDGKEIFYLSGDSKIMSVQVRANGASFESGTVRPLFETRLYRSLNGGFDVTGDGQKFILAYEIGQPEAAITLVENWDAELKKK